MNPTQLKPSLDLLRKEYVLVQAWKKTAAYIRYHNWFSDTLALDRAAVDLREFLGSVADSLRSPEAWTGSPLRMVPAPKTQRWHLPGGDCWEPFERAQNEASLRPLAHVQLRDQVVATALMLCLANRVETRQGDPRESVREKVSRRNVISYGNRLFCDNDGGELRHRWGSAKLYRAYFQDYKTFLSRPEIVAETLLPSKGRRCFIVQSDLAQFYDRVRPKHLATTLRALQKGNDESEFFDLAERVLSWTWDPRDRSDVSNYANQAKIRDFSHVALPQGLVSAGFFSNVALLDFDKEVRGAIGSDIGKGVRLEDCCRYVDDFRIVVTLAGQDSDRERVLEFVREEVLSWLRKLLAAKAPDLSWKEEKTKAAEVGGTERPLVRQSTKMNRIQSAVSGGFDAIGGNEILDAIQGLVRSQEALSHGTGEGSWDHSPVPDIKDEAVARFAAARFRTTYRSIRPLLEDASEGYDRLQDTGPDADNFSSRRVRTQPELDEDARVYALRLVERWIFDPSNVRLLRIGLDLWPDAKVLESVLVLLRPFTEEDGPSGAPQKVAWYCLAEILRAGATETGLVEEQECLPSDLNLAAYREVLCGEAQRLEKLPSSQVPWYLRQQALLFLAAVAPMGFEFVKARKCKETNRYRRLIRFLRGSSAPVKSSEYAILAVLARRSFSSAARSCTLVQKGLMSVRSREVAREIASRDPSFAHELYASTENPLSTPDERAILREDLGVIHEDGSKSPQSLAEMVMLADVQNPALRDELSILRFTRAFIEAIKRVGAENEVIGPTRIRLELVPSAKSTRIKSVEILSSRNPNVDLLFAPPKWCEPDDRWRFQVGFILRFILSRSPDFTRMVRQPHWKEAASAYRPAESHWYQRLYGFFNGQEAFGDDWLPITDWMEHFLAALLQWPGCQVSEQFSWVHDGIEAAQPRILARIRVLEGKYGDATQTLLLPMVTRRPTANAADRPLRACVVQTAIPSAKDFQVSDLTLSDPEMRQKHRKHLSAALAAVERMLALRETHKKRDGRLDWLILPELSVHPADVKTHLVPFARKHKALILAGLTYQELFSGQPFINSALWIIPEWSDSYGLQIRTRRQGKRHLAPSEQAFNSQSPRLQGFRPCQWLIGFPWSSNPNTPPLWLTASVCYDATDLRLAADLRQESDIFAIPALNRDVKTFDQMALALHYHMFQLVIVANSGEFGGSNAYWPSQDPNTRQIFHLHGQPQASIAFMEVDDIADFMSRRQPPPPLPPPTHPIAVAPNAGWKSPPAGLR